MKIIFLMTGKTEEAWLREGLEGYAVRIRKYIPLEIREVPALKNTAGLSQGEWKKN
jgi:23S rRNA (pseudouridine1915-N3)-methyltransferase